MTKKALQGVKAPYTKPPAHTTCYALECTQRIRKGLLMCFAHWSRVELETQKTIYLSLSDMKSRRGNKALEARNTYLSAIRAAREQVTQFPEK